MTHRVRYSAPPISSLAAVSSTLGCAPNHLSHIASNVSDYYIPFQVEKKSGGFREIRAPKPILKSIQRRINTRIFSHCVFPAYLQGSIRDDLNPRDFVSNARIHSKSKSVIAADIKDFYPSVGAGSVKEIFKYLFKFPDDVADLLVSLTTLDGALPQGAPTSSYLANLVFFDVEHKLVEELSRAKLVYTRLIDDITISCSAVLDKNKKEWVVKKIQQMLSAKKLSLQRKKLKLSTTSACGSQVVITGLWIDRGHPRLPSAERDIVRAMVHQLEKDSLVDGKTSVSYHTAHNSVSGKVALMSRLGHSQAPKLRKTLTLIQPEYDATSAKKLDKICRKFASRKGRGKELPAYTRDALI